MERRLIYSVNGKYFEQFGVNVSGSSGFGLLARKEPQKYDYPEQHGSTYDLSNPYFEARTITLNCWIKGASWQELYRNYLNFMAEFKKPETQRLLIEYPPTATPRIYQVITLEESELKKQIKNGKMYAEFDLKLVEPNPIKKVLMYYGNGTAFLKYNSPDPVEIFLPNNLKIDANSNVDTTLNLNASNIVSSHRFLGRNFLKNSWNVQTDVSLELPKPFILGGGRYYFRFEDAYFESAINDRFTVEFVPFYNGYPSIYLDFDLSSDIDEIFNKPFPVDFLNTDYRVFVHPYSVFVPPAGDDIINVTNISLTKDPVDFWTPAPEDTKYIVLAGDVRKITNVQFQGAIIWQEL